MFLKSIISSLHRDTFEGVTVHGKLSLLFLVYIGTQQGCPILPLVFAIDGVLKRLVECFLGMVSNSY